MEGLIGFLKGFASVAMAVIVLIGLIGAAMSADVVFKVAGIAGLIIWLVIVGRSFKHHDVSGKNHNNWL